MPDWGSMTDKEMNDFLADKPTVDSVPESEREKLQVEWCKRAKVKWTMADGSVGYEPPDWKGD